MKIRKLGPVALLWVSTLLVPMIAFAGGTITGVVIDGFTGQPVRSATLASKAPTSHSPPASAATFAAKRRPEPT